MLLLELEEMHIDWFSVSIWMVMIFLFIQFIVSWFVHTSFGLIPVPALTAFMELLSLVFIELNDDIQLF
jgi:hypothetical protein